MIGWNLLGLLCKGIITVHRVGKWLPGVLLGFFVTWEAWALEPGELLQRSLAEPVSRLYAGAERVTLLPENPLLARAEADGKTLGYLFVNSDFVPSIGYSGKPVHVLVALDTQGVIHGARLLEHHEPIVLAGIPESRIEEFISRMQGQNPTQQARRRVIDGISGATVTMRVIDDSVLRSASRVTRLLGGVQPDTAGLPGLDTTPVAVIDTQTTDLQDWPGLVADQSLSRLHLDVATVSQAFAAAGQLEASRQAESDEGQTSFIDLYVAPVSVPAIGLSLLGKAEYANLQKVLQPGQQALLVMAQGLYSFKGSGYVRGGIFDRFEIVQGEQVIRFIDQQHKRIRRVAAQGAPDFQEVDLFYLPADFQVAEPWRLELLVGRATGPTQKYFTSFTLPYRLPEKYLLPPPARVAQEADFLPDFLSETTAEPPLWAQLWREKLPEILGLFLLLGLLTWGFFFQTWLVKRPRLLYWGRIGFLACTLFGLGFYAKAQLSVVNILTVINALLSGFNWEYFLLEPLIFILWGGVFIALLFWGRGAYCGWLCPFGALQELLNNLAKAVGIRQIELPWGLHERLWALKYIIFMVLLGVSLHSLLLAEYMAEVEPFKTTIILNFARAWPFVLFALLMLLPGLFIERFYCRYVCPLGAALAIPGRIRMFDWLKRYRDCGNPCRTCSNECMVGAIHPEGHINPNECLYCMHCQQRYYDDHICPVAIKKRTRMERRGLLPAAPGRGDEVQVINVQKTSA